MKTLRRRVKQRVELLKQSWRGGLTRRLLGCHVSAVVVRTQQQLFAVDPEDFGVGGLLRKKGQYGLEELDRLRPHLTSASRVLIVGAHIGTLVVPIAQLCREVVAVEANPATYNLLLMNLALNDVHNCQAINIAASDKEETLDFLASRANSGGSKRVPKVSRFIYYYDRPETISVNAVALDQRLDGQDFDIVIMDIEGSEYFALRGMQQILTRCQVLVVEFMPHHLRDVSQVSVAEFLAPIAPHFGRLTIPSLRRTVEAADFQSTLEQMYDREQADEAILFEKLPCSRS